MGEKFRVSISLHNLLKLRVETTSKHKLYVKSLLMPRHELLPPCSSSKNIQNCKGRTNGVGNERTKNSKLPSALSCCFFITKFALIEFQLSTLNTWNFISNIVKSCSTTIHTIKTEC